MHSSKSINEMGINLENLPNSYLGKASTQSKNLKVQNESIKDIIDLLKAMTWQEINFDIEGSSESGRTFYILLPAPIIKKIKDYKDTFGSATARSVGSWRQLREAGAIHMATDGDSSFRRSHFPNGIPDSFKGTGLGYKLYRKLLEINTYLRSDDAGTAIKNNTWASLIKTRPAPDDVHAIVGQSSVFALIKTLPVREKIDLVEKYINSGHIDLSQIDKTNFAIDDDLKAILPPALIDLVNNPISRDALEKLRIEAARRREAEAAQAAAERNRQLLTVFGVTEIDTNWQVGDFVVNFALLQDPSARIRIVINHNGIKAVSVADYIKLSVSGDLDRNAVSRNPDRTSWTKIDITAIPDLNEVRLGQAEKSFVKSLIQRNERRAPDPRNAHAIVGAAPRANQYGPLIRVHDTAEFKNLIEMRMLRPETARKIMQGNFVSKILLSPAQDERYSSGLPTEVFVPFDGAALNMRMPSQSSIGEKAINTISGFIYTEPSDNNFTIKSLREVRSRRDIQVGEMVYIANHPMFYGILAKVGMTLINDTGAEYAMLTIFNANLGGQFARKVPIPLAFLRKIA